MSESLSTVQLKKRLLGAAILVLVAAVVIPFLLGEPKQVDAPVEEVMSTEFQSKIQPLSRTTGTSEPEENNASDPTQNQSALVLKKIDPIQPLDRSQNNGASKVHKIEPLRLDTLNSNSRKKTAPEPVAEKAPAAKVAVAAAPQATQPKAQKPAQKAPVLKVGWAVQVGIFSKKSNADAFAKTLRGDGYHPKVSDAKNSSGKTNKRVWLGPFATKSEASTISRKFESQTGNDGYVAPYPFK